MEDALKHLYDCEYKKLVCTSQSIAGALSISADDATELLARLEGLSLIRSEGAGFMLTQEGRSYALRIIRVHRLWERYLADETGTKETDWHPQAELQEHRLTSAQADALAAHMGDPRFDPHGDPIPTSSGELPNPKGQPLTSLSSGDVAEILHIEDEPAIVYEQIVALGLTPGMQVRVLEASKERIVFEAEGTEAVLAPVAARNITVQPIVGVLPVEGPYESLATLEPGESATVMGISRACRGLQRRRLMDLGVLPGTVVRSEMKSAGGDPTAYLIRGATVALRKTQANLIHIRREKGRNK
jgi:DtxR family Mn-dependent transcriptional regulator